MNISFANFGKTETIRKLVSSRNWKEGCKERDEKFLLESFLRNNISMQDRASIILEPLVRAALSLVKVPLRTHLCPMR